MSGSGQRTWGWHRLDDSWARRIVDAAGIRPGELVLDIGAGDGALTAPLVEAGARVIAIELHERRAAALRRRFADQPVKVVRTDAADLYLPTRPFRVVASPPYGISTALLKRLLAPGSQLTRADLVLQRGFVNQALRRPVRRYSLELGLRLPRTAFRPRPQVDSAVLVARRA